MNTTVRLKASQIYKDWHVIDAAGRPLGRVASEAAALLRGKHKPTFERHLDCGDFVIIVNAASVRVTGRKAEQMAYYSHSGFPGGLRRRSFTDQMQLHPDRIIEDAVKGMLPGGPLGKAMARHLKVYAGPNHPHASQVVGSERARTAREANQAALLQAAPRPPARLRPLSIPQQPAEPLAEKPALAPAKKSRKPAAVSSEAVAVQAAPPEPAGEERPKRTRKPAEPAAEPVSTEAVAALPAETAEAPKKRAPRKKAEQAEASSEAPAAAQAPSEDAPKKPARRRTAPKQEE
ncbi:50S ribosomal protein L13 [bacterium]|nr:MAG: 50S ribosomal protein L13 [bacterium]